MEFKLFGRMKDDEGSSGSSTGSDVGQSRSSMGENLSGGSLERTVKNMSDQGYSEDDIMQELQGQYSKQEIQRAMNNAVTDSAMGGQQDDGPEPLTQYSSQQEEEAVSPMDQGYNQNNNDQNMGQQESFQNNQQQGFQNQQPQQQQQQQPVQQQQQIQQPGQTQEQDQGQIDPAVEELIETIVAENFERVRTEFQNVYEELNAVEEQLQDLDDRVHDLEVRDDEDQQQFIQKMDEVEQHIDDYESRIGGLEKAFQQVLPSLVDNVRDLTSLVQEIKQERGIETETDVSDNDVEDMDMENW